MTEYQNDSELYNNYLAGDAGAYTIIISQEMPEPTIS